MTSMPDFEWVDGPPAGEEEVRSERQSWAMLVGVLSQWPGRWVRVEAPRTAVTRFKDMGCEAVSRGPYVYARWPEDGS